jgi:hypothetical protein
VFISETAIVSFVFGDPSEENSSPALVVDLFRAVWTAVIITFVTAPFAFLFTRSGPANMAHSVIDQAHITAQQNRINTLTARLNAQWIQPESEETGKDLCFFLRPGSQWHSTISPPLDVSQGESGQGPHDYFMLKEKWGKGDTVPDTQVFKLDFTTSRKYHKRKIKIHMRPHSPVVRSVSPAWEDGTSDSPETSSSLALEGVKRNATRLASLKEDKAEADRMPTFVVPTSNRSSTDAKALMTSLPELTPSEALKAELKVFDEHFGDDEEESLRVARGRSTSLPATHESLIEEGADYRNLASETSKSQKLVGTVDSDGTLKTRRRWFCCGRRALGAVEQQAIAGVLPKQEDIGDKLERTAAETLALRDRVRRSHRNARFHRARGVTPGVSHYGGGPDMDELRDGKIDEVRLLPLFLPLLVFRNWPAPLIQSRMCRRTPSLTLTAPSQLSAGRRCFTPSSRCLTCPSRKDLIRWSPQGEETVSNRWRLRKWRLPWYAPFSRNLSCPYINLLCVHARSGTGAGGGREKGGEGGTKGGKEEEEEDWRMLQDGGASPVLV